MTHTEIPLRDQVYNIPVIVHCQNGTHNLPPLQATGPPGLTMRLLQGNGAAPATLPPSYEKQNQSLKGHGKRCEQVVSRTGRIGAWSDFDSSQQSIKSQCYQPTSSLFSF